jgi:hypothetical protein
MRSPTFLAIQFVLMLALGLYMLTVYMKLRRAAKVAPEDPKVMKLMKLQWLYILGMACSFIAASMVLADWMMGAK